MPAALGGLAALLALEAPAEDASLACCLNSAALFSRGVTAAGLREATGLCGCAEVETDERREEATEAGRGAFCDMSLEAAPILVPRAVAGLPANTESAPDDVRAREGLATVPPSRSVAALLMRGARAGSRSALRSAETLSRLFDGSTAVEADWRGLVVAIGGGGWMP